MGLILHQKGQSCFMFKSEVSKLLISQRYVFRMVIVNGEFDGMREDVTVLYFIADNRNIVQHSLCPKVHIQGKHVVTVKSFPSTPWRHIEGVEVQLHSFLALALDRAAYINFISWPLYAWENPQYPMDRRLSGPQSQCGHVGEDKNLFPLPGYEPQTVQPVA
jgi:hypothetical protein